MGERLKPTVLKTVVRGTVPGVRIPLPPFFVGMTFLLDVNVVYYRGAPPAGRSNLTSEFPASLPVFGCCSRGTAKRLREMALVGETCLDRDKRNGFLAKQ